jgi:peptide/nickel transport system substrate-binding protein
VDYATHGFPPATEQQFARLGLRILRPPVFNGPAILINYNDPALAPLRRKEVRQALMYAINREENARISLAASGVPIKVVAGFSDNLVPLWLTDETISMMNPYPYDPARAESVLLNLGFRRGGDGVWQDPDGNRMEYEILFQAEFADWSAAGKNVADQLTKFGVKITPRSITFTQFNNEVFAGRFQLATGSWGAAHPHPHFSFVQDFLFYNPPQAPGPGSGFPLVQQTDTIGEVDVMSMTLQAADGLDVAAQKDLIQYLARVFNELLPMLPLWERYGNNPVLDGVRVTGWPPDNDPIYKNSPYADSFVIMMLYEGRLRPVR